MALGEHPFVWPFRGLNKNEAESNQPELSTDDAQNVRGIDPDTGRTRGAQRSGSKKHVDTQISGTNVVRAGAQLTYDSKTVDYADPAATLDTTDDILTIETPSKKTSGGVKLDKQNNLYVLDGASGLVKYNSEGTLLTQLSFPVGADALQVRAFEVDVDDAIYAGVSGKNRTTTGEDANGIILGDPDPARIWRYRLTLEGEYEQAWSIPDEEIDGEDAVLGGFCEALRVVDGFLYAVINDPTRYRSWVRKYGSITSANPKQEWEWEVPYPATDVDVNSSGEVLVSCEEFTLRGTHPEYPDSSQILPNVFTWRDLDETHKIWCVLDPREQKTVISTGGTVAEEDDDVLELHDATGNERNLYFIADQGDAATQLPPAYVEDVMTGLPGVRFNGVDSVMRSIGNPGSDIAHRDQQKTLFPAYIDADDDERACMFAAIMVLRVTTKAGGADADSQQAFYQGVTSDAGVADTSNEAHQLILHRNSTEATPQGGGSGNEGTLVWYTESDDGVKEGHGGTSATHDTALHHSFQNTQNLVMVTVIFDGGVDSGDSTTKTRSLVRVNGVPVDRWQGQYKSGTDRTEVGMGSIAGEFAEFDLVQFICLDRKDPDSAAEPKIISHPRYPDSPSISSGGVGRVEITVGGAGWGASASGALSFTGGGGSGATGTWTANGSGVIVSTAITATGSGYTSAPTVTATGSGSGETLEARMFDNSSPTDLEKLEGGLAWQYGFTHLLPGSATQTTLEQDKDGHTYTVIYPHPYKSTPPTNDATNNLDKYTYNDELVLKVTGDGTQLKWVFAGPGSGYGVRADSQDRVITIGDSSSTDTDSKGTVSLRRLVDNGDSVSTTGDGFTAEADLIMDNASYRIDLDAQDNIYYPCKASGDTGDAFAFQVINAATEGTLTEYKVGSGTSEQGFHAIAVPKGLVDGKLAPVNPEYESDLTRDCAEWVVIAGEKNNYAGSDQQAEVRKVRLVTVSHNTDPPRATVGLAVSNGDLKKFTAPSTVATPTGGSGAFDTAARYIDMAVLFQKLYATDGESYIVYDPKDGTDGTVSTYKSTTAGEIPPRGRLLTDWNGRIVVARFADDPQNWSMSAKDDPDDWDEFPPVVVATQAVSGNNPIMGGRNPDIINTMIPVSDDLLIFGGDHSIHRVTGDPMAGGQIDLISANTGMSFGRPWTRDDKGNIWFFGSRGGLWVMDPAGLSVVEATDFTASRDLQGIDFTTYHIRLEYDFRHEGIWICQCPFGAGGTAVTHWFYDTKHDALWPDKYGASTVQPTSLWTLDGDDADDRVVVFGTEGGYVNEWDEDEKDDDGQAIASRVLLGPFSVGSGRQMRAVDASFVLADDQDGCLLRVYKSATPDSPGKVHHTAELHPGRNSRVGLGHRPTADFLWFELVQAGKSQRFALESGFFRFAVAGRSRVIL